MRVRVTCKLCSRLIDEVTYTFGVIVVRCHFCPWCDRLMALAE